MSMPMSFSMRRATTATGLFIVVFALLGFFGPVAYFGWWGLCGGHEWEIQHRIKKLITASPRQEAVTTLANMDYRLYCTGGIFDPVVPGFGPPQKAYRKIFGYRGFTTFEGESLPEDQRRLNNQAFEHMAEFNKIVYAAVEKHYPDWHTKYKEQD